MSQYFIIQPCSVSREATTCSGMTADRDAIYEESTDEESENLPGSSVLAPGKRNTFITFVEYLTWAYYSIDNKP